MPHAKVAAAALLLLVATFGCERAPDSGSAASQSASDRLREAASSLKKEASNTANTIKEEAKQVGEQVREASHEARQQVKESAAVMKEEAIKAWAAARDNALDLSAKALDSTRETLAALREKAAQASETARPMIERAAEELEKRSQAIREKSDQLKTSAPEEWQKSTDELTPELKELQSAAEAAAKQFGVPPTPSTRITGTLIYRERMVLPPDAEITIRLVDVSKADAPAVVAETTFKPSGQVPLPFELPYDAAKIDQTRKYAVEATLLSDGKPFFRTADVYYVLTNGRPAKVDMVLKSAN